MREIRVFNSTAEDEVNGTFGTAFATFYESMTNVPFFGTQYNYIVPLFILIIGLLTLLRFHNKMQKLTKKVRKRKKTQAEEIAERKGGESEAEMIDLIKKGEAVILDEYRRRNRTVQRRRVTHIIEGSSAGSGEGALGEARERKSTLGRLFFSRKKEGEDSKEQTNSRESLASMKRKSRTFLEQPAFKEQLVPKPEEEVSLRVSGIELFAKKRRRGSSLGEPDEDLKSINVAEGEDDNLFERAFAPDEENKRRREGTGGFDRADSVASSGSEGPPVDDHLDGERIDKSEKLILARHQRRHSAAREGKTFERRGELMKKKNGRTLFTMTTWQRRFFHLQGHVLKMFRNVSDEYPSKQIEIATISHVVFHYDENAPIKSKKIGKGR